MLLQNENAVIYGAGGSLGCAFAGAFTRQELQFFYVVTSLNKSLYR